MADSALPDLYRHFSGNNDDDNTSLPSTGKAPDKPPSVISELGSNLVTLQCISGRSYSTPRNDFSSNFHVTSIQEPPQLVIQVGGTDIWYIDTPPKSECPVHRTTGLDFLVQILGEMEVTHFTGEQQIIRPGDLTIQGSTFTKWRNPSRYQWARMMGFMSTARSIGKEDPPSRAGFSKL
ncbi:uncharacterized protein N7511_008382 [Penicillium nucicola]|uniref:uncharacterized protein n=1 Tax=Penicillium nucicola TaxID=1850975 RepID=UPI002544E567|nr:uncharacterized protein N7511_008382 [Penicillium nucicola]KAJ5751417.1 hypothetical protein N7511_008382 [Penicillium nucicola]